MIKKTLAIFGDSWGRGAWTKPDGSYLYDTNGDNYFSEKFEKYYSKVDNFSVGGSSNIDTFRSISDYLSTETILGLREKNTQILVIQTEPMRSVIPGIHLINLGSSHYYQIFKNVDYKTFNETMIDFFYFNLNEIGKKYKIRINLTGGCSDVSIQHVKRYPFINVCCESFYSLIDSSNIPSIYTTTHDVSKAIKKFTRASDCVVQSIAKKQGIQSTFQGDLFGYALDSHPSRKGIDMWVEHIYKKIR